MLSTVVIYFVLRVLAAQVPLGLSPESNQSLEFGRASKLYNSNTHSIDTSNPDISPWHFDKLPSANATGHLVFETVNSLLQHWPNTRYRNGHAIVPGIIPKGTLLYHGTQYNKIPTVPEWTSTDPEHSILFCRDQCEPGCWHLTLATTRPLKVLYFDGSSAAHSLIDPLDTQNIIAWGELRPDWWLKERQRLGDLCRWGGPYAVDGYVRMEMDFEVMLCDFTAGLEVVSFSNLNKVPPFSTMPPPISGDTLLYIFEVTHAGSWHNRYPGDTRINLDLAGIISLCDTTLVPSLVDMRAGQERCDHRIQGISATDIERVRRSVSDALVRSQDDRSGVDWKTLFRVITDRYSDRLELMKYLLNSTSEGDALIDQARKVHVQLRIMLTPYIFHDTAPPNAFFDSTSIYAWATPVFKACGTTHTSSIALYASSLNPSERLLLRAVQETMHEICRITTRMWAAGVLEGLDVYIPLDSTPDAAEVARLVETWRQQLSGLMEWLDWSVWVKCRPACGPEEMCYLPTWPFSAPPPPEDDDNDIFDTSFATKISFQQSLLMDMNHMIDEDEWRKPKPRCIRRLKPFTTF